MASLLKVFAVVVLAAVQAASGAQPFAWSAERRLTWSDFLGRPQMGTSAVALTSYRFTFEGECLVDRFTFRVASLFRPDMSWVKPVLLFNAADGDLALQHEQTHFDLSEVHVRRLRRALQELVDPCSKTSEERNDIARRVLQEDADAQRRYDEETGHGVDTRQQGRWNEDVRRQLAALRQYSH